jgi:hypothetical protein
MTISTTDSKISYNGNGVTTDFAFPYPYLAVADLQVLRVGTTGIVTTLVLNTDYTVSNGTVSVNTAPGVGERLVINRVVEIVQETDYITGDPFPAETHERALDRLTMIAQQLAEEAGRSVKVGVTSTADPDALLASIEASEAAADASAQAADASAQAADASAQAADASAQAAAGSAASINLPLAFSSIQNIATARLLGRATAGTGDVEEISLGTNLSFAGTVLNAAGVTIASTAEAQAGTDNTKAISPLRLREGLNASGSAPIYACRAWVNFNGTGTVAIRASGNVSSITDNGTGDYTVNFTTAMPDANYVAQQSAGSADGVGRFAFGYATTPSTTTYRLTTSTFAGASADFTFVSVAIFR